LHPGAERLQACARALNGSPGLGYTAATMRALHLTALSAALLLAGPALAEDEVQADIAAPKSSIRGEAAAGSRRPITKKDKEEAEARIKAEEEARVRAEAEAKARAEAEAAAAKKAEEDKAKAEAEGKAKAEAAKAAAADKKAAKKGEKEAKKADKKGKGKEKKASK